MKSINISYNYETDKTTVSLTKEFRRLPTIHRLDSIQDSLCDLEGIYNATLDKLHRGEIEGEDC